MEQVEVEPEIEHWILAKNGISLLINNQPSEALNLFQQHPNSIQMAAGYSFVTFMDALMSFEEDKLNVALTTLRETERKCSEQSGWVKSFKTKVLGSQLEDVAHTLECQIILADTQVCVAILTFLQQEFTGYLRGSWVLRKAWKIYQQTYAQVLKLYKDKIGNLNLPDPTDFTWEETIASTSTSPSSTPDPVPETSSAPTPGKTKQKNGYKPNISYPRNMQHSRSSYFVNDKPRKSPNLPRSATMVGEGSGFGQNKSSSDNSLWGPLTEQFAYLTNFNISNLSLMEKIDPNAYVAPETISRLMGAVCFGFGVLQLGISLLPPSLLRITSFLGFTGNRTAGISNLMYARKGSDMRAPLAMLALLWYHTIVRPFYALDGTNVTAGVEAALLLIEESQKEYSSSALFLFFKGRIYRLDSNIPKALESFQQAVDNSLQREIKLLALHEVGWCHLIQLDYEKAQKTFVQLRTGSRWSRSFYTYLLIICMGASSKIKDCLLIIQFLELLKTSQQKGAQLEIFMNRRAKLFPTKNDELPTKSNSYWKMYIYELLFFWNALPSCSRQSLEQIIRDCESVTDEPMPGVSLLIQGECYNIMRNFDGAISSLRRCLNRRKAAPKEHVHISAHAEFILGSLLVKTVETRNEGKQLILHASNNYKDYDFDNKLQVRADNLLKNIDR